MKIRCQNPLSDSYENYGGRGITVCERWHSFENFLADMGERPAGMTLDRIDNERGYEPGNCRWATKAEQQRNQRGVMTAEQINEVRGRFEHGESQPSIAKRFGVRRQTINRILLGLRHAGVAMLVACSHHGKPPPPLPPPPSVQRAACLDHPPPARPATVPAACSSPASAACADALAAYIIALETWSGDAWKVCGEIPPPPIPLQGSAAP